MPKRKIAIEIFAPIEGLHTELSPSMITGQSTPNVQNANAYYGVVQKDYGTSLFCTGTVGGPVPSNYIFECPFNAESVLEAFTHTGNYKLVDGTGFTKDGQTYTGTFTDIWNGAMYNDDFIYTNASDSLQAKLAYNTTGTNMGGNTAIARAVVGFKAHLNLYHTTEGGTASPFRIRWSQAGALGYTSTDWGSGTAGFLDLPDSEGVILTAAGIGGGAVVVYCAGSIHLQQWVGGSVVYQFTKMIGGLDIPSRRCVAVNDDIHYFFTRENIYEYRGGRDLIAIGDPIKALYQQTINPNTMDTAFVQFIKEDEELRLYVPSGSATQPDKCFICKVRDGYKWFLTDRQYTSHGKFTRQSAITIGDLVGNIGAQNWKFGDMVSTVGAPVYIMGDQSGNMVQMDKTLYSASQSATGTAKAFVFDTKDFSANKDVDPEGGTGSRYDPSEYMDNDSRWLSVYAEARGDGTLGMQYSTDGGAVFAPAPEGGKTITTTWQSYQWDVDVAAESFRARFTNTGTNEVAHIRHIKVEFVPGSVVGE